MKQISKGSLIYKLRSVSDISSVILAFVVMFSVTSIIFARQNFFSFNSINNLLTKACTDGGILALGITFVMLAGYIDLSVGSTLALSGVIAAWVCTINPILGIFAGLATGLVCGLLNGVVVAKMGISPFVATLATMMGLRGFIYLITNKRSVSLSDEVFAFVGASVGPVSVPVIILFALTLLCIHIGHNTRFGMAIYAVGGNEEAARMMGLKVDRIKIGAYAMCGLFSGIGGVVLTARLYAAQAVAGENWETTVIACAALGGIKLSGGEGRFLGAFFGVLIVSIIKTFFNYAGNINTWWQNIIMGLLLMAAIAAQSDIFKRFLPKKGTALQAQGK
jgi:ribose/xylose/arabinose/galactoside ABC-type transport system permease subunit